MTWKALASISPHAQALQHLRRRELDFGDVAGWTTLVRGSTSTWLSFVIGHVLGSGLPVVVDAMLTTICGFFCHMNTAVAIGNVFK